MSQADVRFDEEFDVVVCGGGGAGLAAALFSAWRQMKCLVLEKAPALGGTTRKSAFLYWIPNNEAMRAQGKVDDKSDFMRFVARVTAPLTYDPEAPLLGLTAWQHAMFEAFYESASPAVELLAAKGALPYTPLPIGDYWSELPEDKNPVGRVFIPKGMNMETWDGGEIAITTMASVAERDGVTLRTSHAVQRILTNTAGRVVGVEAKRPDGSTLRVRARKGVVFASGGFLHNPDLRSNFLSIPSFGGCAALTNEGDLLRMASGLPVQLRNMNYGWQCPVLLERAVNRDPELRGIFHASGDSMLYVNKYGKRAFNEKLQYNEAALGFTTFDATRCEYPNIVMVAVWDEQAQNNHHCPFLGAFIVPPGSPSEHVIRGETLEELVEKVDQRLQKYKALTNVTLQPEFLENLRASIARFNELAADGKDLDFKRGERPIERMLVNRYKQGDGQKNPTMRPLASKGPYFAALLAPGHLDTKGGPKTDTEGRVLDLEDKPIAGLYGVGNCVASPSAASYWAAGATFGPLLALAYRAAGALETAATD